MSELSSLTSADGQQMAYTSADAARLIGISPRTLKNWRWAGKGPRPTRVSSACVLYRREDLDAWLRETQRRGGAA